MIDGRTVLVTVEHRRHTLRVDLAGVGLDSEGRATDQAKEFLSKLLPGKSVEVLVNSSWDDAKKKSAEVTGVLHLTVGGVDLPGNDVGLQLLSKGLVKFQEPPPYSTSSYIECEDKNAEAKARSEKLGIWANHAGA